MSITSKTDISNMSMDLLSAGNVVDVDNPSNATEELLSRWYEQSRRKVLREHPWNFAIKRELLAASATAPAFGYSTAFPLPADFVRVVVIEDGNGGTFTPDDYAIENGEILLSTDASSLRLVYIYDIQDVTRFDPMFIDLLAHEIALAVAYRVTQSNGNVERLEMLAKTRGALAKAVDGQERPPTRREKSRNITARQMGRSNDTTRIRF